MARTVGNVLSQNDANGTVTTRTYNARNKVLTIQTKNAALQLLASSTSIYDADGLLSSITHENGDIISYTYDAMHHLLTETKMTAFGGIVYSYAYTYDDLGNRLSMNKSGVITNYAYNNLNQLTQSVTSGVINTYTYNNNGNQINTVVAGATTTSTYDFDNRLTNMTYADGTSSVFVYSADGRRLQASEGTSVTNYLYDGKLPVIERDGANVTQNTYTNGIGYAGGIGSLISQISGTTTSWYHYVHNGNGNVSHLTDASGAVVASYDYDAFGNIAAQTGTIANTRQFQTKEVNAKSGLIYFGRRWYNPVIGRWTTPDPLGMIDGPNMYLYVNDDPVNKSDSWGLCGGFIEAFSSAVGSAVGFGTGFSFGAIGPSSSSGLGSSSFSGFGGGSTGGYGATGSWDSNVGGTVTINVGFEGIATSFQITATSSSITGYVGIGVGTPGVGVSVTSGINADIISGGTPPSGLVVDVSTSGGNGKFGSSVDVVANQGGFVVNGGVGKGFGNETNTTVGFSGTFRFK
jgi:RHS repeat-associated protein